MDKAIAKAISTVIFGVGILVAGIGSSLPPCTCVAVIVIAIGLVSAFGDR